MTLFSVLDVVLVFGLYLRITHLLIADGLGKWWFQEPIWELFRDDPEWDYDSKPPEPLNASAKFLSGLDCVWCIPGFWIGCCGSLLSLYLVGGPGHAAEWWRWVAGAFTMNYIGAHIGARLGDTGHEE